MTTTYQHALTLARTLILDELSALSLYKARRGTDPPQNGPFSETAGTFDGFVFWCYTRALYKRMNRNPHSSYA
jgi:hypothetical protein